MNTLTNMESADTSVELDLAERALNLAKARQRWDAIKDIYTPIIRALQRIGIEPKLSSDIDVIFTGDAHKLAAAVRILRTNGFSTTSKPPTANSPSWGAFYAREGVGTDVWLNFSSSVCRIVKVGTKMVEQPIYETVCGETGVGAVA